MAQDSHYFSLPLLHLSIRSSNHPYSIYDDETLPRLDEVELQVLDYEYSWRCVCAVLHYILLEPPSFAFLYTRRSYSSVIVSLSLVFVVFILVNPFSRFVSHLRVHFSVRQRFFNQYAMPHRVLCLSCRFSMAKVLLQKRMRKKINLSFQTILSKDKFISLNVI